MKIHYLLWTLFEHELYHVSMVKCIRYLSYFKQVAIEVACCALVVKGLGECLCGGLILEKLWPFSSVFTFSGETFVFCRFSLRVWNGYFAEHLLMLLVGAFFIFSTNSFQKVNSHPNILWWILTSKNVVFRLFYFLLTYSKTFNWVKNLMTP